jgi:hypothetical protein
MQPLLASVWSGAGIGPAGMCAGHATCALTNPKKTTHLKHDVLQVLGQSLKKVLTTHSSYIGSADCNWDDIAAQVILQCDGALTIVSQDVFELLTGDKCAEDCIAPFSLVRPNAPIKRAAE